MELRFARARPLFRLRSAYADPKVPFRGIYETDRGNGKAAVSRCVASILGIVAYECFRFCHWGFLGGEPSRAGRLARVRCRRSPSGRLPRYGYAFARNDKAVRNLLSLPPRGKVDCRSIAKARRMRGKRRYVFIRFIPLIRHSARLRSHSCHLPARSIATSPLWLKTVACGLFLRCFAPPRRAPRGKALAVVTRLRYYLLVFNLICRRSRR